MSNRTPGGRERPIADAGGPDAAGLVPADYRASFKKVNPARFVSVGHASGRWDVDVYANDAAARAIETRAKDAPVGAIVVEEHYERPEGTAGPIMVMEKKAKGFAAEHGDWRYASLGASGQPARDTAACAGCHDEAPMDGFFPVP